MAGGVCVVGGYAWWGVCMARRGCAWQGACMAGGMHGGVCVWQGAGTHGQGDMHGRGATAAGGTHPTGMHSCLVISVCLRFWSGITFEPLELGTSYVQ